MTIYIDGIMQNSTNGPTGTKAAQPTMRIGNLLWNNSGFLIGAIDDVKIFDRALAANEIATLTTGSNPTAPFYFISAKYLGTNTCRFNLQVNAGQTYYLLSTTNLLIPNSWITNETFTPATTNFTHDYTVPVMSKSIYFRLQAQ